MNRDRLKARLLETIDLKRKQMIEAANQEDYTSDNVVKYSQELDMLLNKYQKLILEENDRASGSFSEFVHTITKWTLTERYS